MASSDVDSAAASAGVPHTPRPHYQLQGGARHDLLRGRGNGHRGRGRGRGKGTVSRNKADETTQREEDGNAEPIKAMDARQAPPQKSPQAKTKTSENNEDVDRDDAEVCFICASPVIHNSVAPCNHRTCHICSLRLRALYKTNACAHCRTGAEFVIFTDEPEKRYEDFTERDFEKSDKSLGIKYEKNEIFEDTVLLLRYNCPDAACDVACFGWPDLHRHVKVRHQKVMCDLCTRNKKVFTHEHELFTPASLRKHERNGDDNPGAADQSGFKGHPECGFCRQRFYGDDELYAHCRDRHERCHICDRRTDPGHRQQQYYLDYNALEVHFSKDHFLCPDRECLEKKFTVFESEMDLKAHQLETHPNGLTKDARKDARRVDMSGFDYRSSQHQQQRQGQQGRRGGGRGRDPNANADAPLPSSSAQPLRRDEVAYQRQVAIQSSQSVTSRTFGGQLTSNEAVAARPAPNTSAPATVMAPREGSHTTPLQHHTQPTTTSASDLPNIASLDLTSTSVPPPSSNLTPAERARYLRHASLTERASNLLGHSQSKLNTFRSEISHYKTDNITASQLVDVFFALFDCPTSDLGTLIKELADAFEVPGKNEDLRKAWNDWRAINEDYPSLPGGTDAGSTTSAGGKRILKLKSSTARSSRSVTNRPSGWGAAAASGTRAGGPSGSALFPALPSSGGGGGGAKKPAWAAGTPNSGANSNAGSRPSSARPPANRASTAPGPSVDAFPSLPMAQKPGMSALRPGHTGNPVRRDGANSPAPANAWVNGGGLSAPPPQSAEAEDVGDAGVKRKGKKKQTLIHWG